MQEIVKENDKLAKGATDKIDDQKNTIGDLEKQLELLKKKDLRSIRTQTELGGDKFAKRIMRFNYSSSDEADSYDDEIDGVKKMKAQLKKLKLKAN